MDGNYIFIVGLISITVMLTTMSLLRYKARARVHKTLQSMLDKEVPLTPELVDRLTVQDTRGMTDLRRGVVILFIGIAAVIAGFISGALMEFSRIAVFPIFMGVAFLIVWKINNRLHQS